jgi:hypothetical protein
MDCSISLQAIPEQCSLLQLIANKKLSVELLQSLPSSLRFHGVEDGNDQFIPDPDSPYREFDEAVVQLIAEHQGIENRYCFLGLRYQWLQWMLDRCATAEETDIARTAIKGESQVFPSGIGAQELPIYWTTPDTCKRISLWLSSIEDSRLLADFDPVAMLDANLYGWKPVAYTGARFERIQSDFHSLKKLYLDVSSCSEAVLVVID